MRLVAGLCLALAVLATAGGGRAATTYELLVSTSPDRSAAVALDGATVSGSIYAFTTPATDVKEVRFFLDDPSMTKSARKVERGAPHDFAGTAPDGGALPFETSGIADGQHTITAAIYLLSGAKQVLQATVTVANGDPEPPPPPPPSSYELRLSLQQNRSAPVALPGAVVSGDVYVFTAPTTGVKEVRFYLDDPTRSRSPRKVERGAPHDFAGSASNGDALPFDTTGLADGSHVITADVLLTAGGSNVVSATFTVANSGPALRFVPAAAGFATEPGVDPPAQTASLETSDARSVGFSITDDADWLDVSPTTGSTPGSLTLAVDTTALASGTYNATIGASAAGYTAASMAVTLDIQGSAPPDQIHLAWVSDPATTMTVIWRTASPSSPSRLEYRLSGAGAWQQLAGAPRASGTSGTLHEATLAPLTPATSYDYRVQGDGGAWSDVYTTRTAPARGPADFEAIYVADTGLIGRADGLATGTQQVIDEIRALDPELVLLGGDYAYYNTDKRYGSLDNTIDAWFNQMQPIGTRAPMMVTYGNHETLLQESFADWSPRFATPAGHDSRRNYSFDVGDVHFVSIFAVTETTGLSSSTLAWIEQDVESAYAAGQRWIIPFFHVSPFSDGTSHPSNLALRSQLGPLFERLGVKLALASHDQTYERTYPLRNVPSANTPTSSALRCYTPADGVTWAKISPGGKLSSKNGDFSQFRTNPAPAYTAVRENTMHHFARLLVSASGSITLETYGVRGDGSPPVVVDRFQYTTGDCPEELRFAEADVFLDVVAGSAAERQLSLGSSDGAAAAFAIAEDAPWLTVSPATGSTPANLTLAVDSAGLPPGSYTATIAATGASSVGDLARVTLRVHDLLVSTSPDRSAPISLAGRTVSDDIYVHTEPTTGVSRVRFWLDNPMSKSPRKTENGAPFDFAGTASSGAAIAFETTTVSNGTHTITAAVDLASGGTKVVTSTFTVANE